MDIYAFINSPDVAAHCCEINKTWTPFEMAVIIGRSRRPMIDRHTAWRALINEYPDMATPATSYYDSYPSLHRLLAELIEYEERELALFKTSETGAVYTTTFGGMGIKNIVIPKMFFQTTKRPWLTRMIWGAAKCLRLCIERYIFIVNVPWSFILIMTAIRFP